MEQPSDWGNIYLLIELKQKYPHSPPSIPQEVLAGLCPLLQEIVIAHQEEIKVWGVGVFLHSLEQRVSEHAPYVPEVQ